MYVGQLNTGSELDIAVTLKDASKIAVILGNGNGSFQTMQEFSHSGTGPQALDGGDFDQDGDVDLVIANYQGSFTVFTNNSSGTFAESTTISCGSPSNLISDIKVLDYNKDLDPDVLALNSTGGNICLSAGVSGANFITPTTVSTSTGSPQKFVTKDINVDGVADLIVGSSNGRVAGFLGQVAAPYFVALPEPYMIGGTTITSIDVANLNKDGINDILIATDSPSSSNAVGVLLGLSGADFAPPYSYKTGSGPVSIAIGDLNSDGFNDLVTANSGSGGISVLKNINGTSFSPKTDYLVSGILKAVALGDITGDGILDVIVATNVPSAIVWAPGVGNATFGSFTTINASLASNPTDISAVDIDGDSRNDIIFSNANTTYGVGRIKNSSASGLVPEPVITHGNPIVGLSVGFLNSGTDPDFGFVASSESSITLFTGGAGTAFAALATLATSSVPTVLALLDFDLDGDRDVIALLESANQYVAFINAGGTFSAPAYGGNSTILDQPKGLDGADVNNDTKMDLVVSNFGNGTVRVFPGSGSGTFSSGTPYFVGFQPSKVVLADVTGDNVKDLVVLVAGSNWISVLKGKTN